MYDYVDAVKNDIRNYIEENLEYYEIDEDTTLDEVKDKLYDDMWNADRVTGNGSGSYFFNTYESEKALFGNLELLAEACEEFGTNTDVLKDGAESCDVTIRCYLLGSCLEEVIDEYEDMLEELKRRA